MEPAFTLGHENAGWVHAVGQGVTAVAEGDAVVVDGPWGCGTCVPCSRGCENPAGAPIPGGGGGLGLGGGMADYLLVPSERFLLPLPDGVDVATGAALTDAGLTPYHAVRRSWSKMTPDATVAIIGVGGLGHVAVQIVKVTTGARVVALDVKPEALEFARQHGADVTLTSDEHAADALRELLALAARGAVTVDHTRYALDDALDAYHDLADGKVRGRAVVVP